MIAMMMVRVAGLFSMLDMAVLMCVPVGLSNIMRHCRNRDCSKSY